MDIALEAGRVIHRRDAETQSLSKSKPQSAEEAEATRPRGFTETIIGAASHSAQLLTYLKISGLQIGQLLNFNKPVLKRGIKRLVNRFREVAPHPVTSAPS